MYSSETIKKSGRNRRKRSGGIGNESATRIDMETRGFGEWIESDGKKGKTTTRGKMVATRSEWKSLVE